MAGTAKAHSKAVKRLLTLIRDAVPPQIPEGGIAQPAYEWMLSTEDA